MNLAAVNATREPIAFPAYYSLISPAMRDAARGPLRRARHNGRPCSGVDRTRLCDECEQTLADHLLDGYGRLRKSLAGAPPRTRTGEPVREMELVVRWLTSPEAASDRIDPVACQIRRRPSEDEQPEIRAARAQLVHHPLRSLEARVRRADAMRRGASAQPQRDLRMSDWAYSLREDGAAFDLLVDAVLRLRNGAVNLYDVPVRLLVRHHLDLAIAKQLLYKTLDRLRSLRPAFYLANATSHLDQNPFPVSDTPQQSPEDVLLLREEETAARRTLSMLFTGERKAHMRARYQVLLARICAADPMSGSDLVMWTAREFGVTTTAADRFVRRLIRLISRADLDWIADQCRSADAARYH